MFYDEKGKHVRTKKEVLDEDGKIRKGCSFVSKGEAYNQQLFTTKDVLFKSKEFLQEEKEVFTELMNKGVEDEKQKLQVFKSNGVYLPTKKIGKNNPKEAAIVADNKARLENTTEHIGVVEGKIIPDLERQLKNVSGWGKGKKRAEIEGKIKEEKRKLQILKQSGERIIQSEGYENISEFVKIYNKSVGEMLKYNKAIENYKKHGGETPDKESVHKRLERAKQEVRERNVRVPAKKKIDRGER